jgi:flagellar basal body L-ring protein FlgH
MKRANIIIISCLGLCPSAAFSDSLLDSPVLNNTQASSPGSPYVARARERPVYDFRVHDTIMVNVNINDTIQFSKKQDTKNDTNWALQFKNFIDNFGGAVKPSLPYFDIKAKSERKTKGSKQDSSKVRLDVPCEIIEILPTGDLVIEGFRTVHAANDHATVRLGGRINPKYIDAINDSVLSERILQLEVKTDYTGPLADNEKRGFVSKILDKFKIF